MYWDGGAPYEGVPVSTGKLEDQVESELLGYDGGYEDESLG